MNRLIAAECRRLSATRLWWIALLVAALLGGGLIGALTLAGPESFTPPMPGLDTESGVRSLLGLLGITAFIPGALGTMAVASEYRQRTITVTYLFAPRRWQVLAAKLVSYGMAGALYGLVLTGTAGAAFFGGAAARGVSLGLPAGTIIGLLARIGLAMAVYTVLGVAAGALIRNQIAALCVVVGYLYAGETLLLMIPGVHLVYPVLPGGATAALTGFTYLADAIGDQVSGQATPLLPPAAGALVLLGYTVLAAAVALAAPLRRDVT